MPFSKMSRYADVVATLVGGLEGHTRDLLRGTAATFLVRLFGTGTAFALNLAVARLLGASSAGIFFLGMTTLSIAMVVGRVGLDNAIVRYVSASAACRDFRAVEEIYRTGAFISTFASLIVAFAMWTSAPWLSEAIFDEPQLAPVLRYMSLAVIPACLLLHHAASMKGLSRVGWASLFQPHQGGVLVPMLALCGLLFLGDEAEAGSASAIYFGSLTITALIALAAWRVMMPRVSCKRFVRSARGLIVSGIQLLWVQLSNLATAWVPIVLLGVFASSADVGVFTVAYRTAALASFVLIAVNSIAAPKFATLFTEGHICELRAVVSTSSRLLCLSSLPILVVLVTIPDVVLSLFGDEFSSTGPWVLRILAIGQFVNALTGSANLLLMMTGRELVLRNIMIQGGIANLILNLIMIPAFGMIGAAAATSITIAGVNMYQVKMSRTHLDIDPLSWRHFASARTVQA